LKKERRGKRAEKFITGETYRTLVETDTTNSCYGNDAQNWGTQQRGGIGVWKSRDREGARMKKGKGRKRKRSMR